MLDSREAAVAEFVARAHEFRRPEALAVALEQCRAGLTKDAFFNDPANQPLRDGWQAVMFGLGYEAFGGDAIEVRLCHPDRFPDFQVRIGGSVVLDFEATMALRRKLGAQFRGDSSLGPLFVGRPTTLPPFDPTPIIAAVEKKVRKHYGADVHLALYLNYSAKGAEVEDVAAAVQRAGGDKFASVWVQTVLHLACTKGCAALKTPDGWVRVPVPEAPAEDASATANSDGAAPEP